MGQAEIPCSLADCPLPLGRHSGSADLVVHSVDVIGTGISETVNTVKESSGDAINFIKIIMEAVHYLVNRFSSR